MGTIVKNMLALLGSQVATWVITLVMVVILPRYLGDTQFGVLAFAGSFVGFFGLVAGLGSATFITKEVARDTTRAGFYVFNALVMNALLVAALALLAIGAAWALRLPAVTILIVAVSCIPMWVGTLNNMLVAGLQGEQRMGQTAVWSVADRYVANVAIIAAVAARKGLIGVALASACSGIVSTLGNGRQLWRQLRAGARVDLRLWKLLALGGMPFLLWNAALMVYGSIDTPMLSFMAGNTTVGWYALAYKLINVPAFMGPLVVTAFFPALSAQGAGQSPHFAALANRALRLIFFASAPMAVGLVIVAGQVITLLHYPAGFEHSVPLIRILAWHIPLVGIDMVLGAVLMASDRQKQWVVVGCLAAVLNPLLNLGAIPLTIHAFGNGAVGTSAITVATELFMMGGAVYLRPRGVLDRATLGFLLRCALACLPIVAVGVAAGGSGLAVKVALGIAGYAAASLLLRTISVREVRRRGLQIVNLVRLRGAATAP